MANALINMSRLARAGFMLARHGASVVPQDADLPGPVRLLAKMIAAFGRKKNVANTTRLSTALTSLGPSYIKLGQFLATRDDLVGADIARDLTTLQDKLPPFSSEEARRTIETDLGKPVSELYEDFGPPVAAASIAQVHKAVVRDASGALKPVAVKVLRPKVEERFRKDLETYFFAARMVERLHPPTRRLRPVTVVDTLARSTAIEMDLRMEAAALSEMADNTADDHGFRVPTVDWARSGRRVLTLEWIDGIPMSDVEGLRAAGYDLDELGAHLIRSFLRHAMRDGFFHADMHQGNLFVDRDGQIVAVDCGIMGRLGAVEQRFLAEILYGFITRDYRRVSQVHFDAGYVPREESVEVFAQALRAIGEPLMGRTADQISMGHLLGQLFQYTEVFNMRTQPQLILLQKTMVVVEGVARTLDPRLNIWTASEPVVRDWMEKQIGPDARIQDAAEGAASLGRLLSDAPRLISEAEQVATSFAAMASDGLRLDKHSIERLAEAQASQGGSGRWALWIGALSLAAIAAAMVL